MVTTIADFVNKIFILFLSYLQKVFKNNSKTTGQILLRFAWKWKTRSRNFQIKNESVDQEKSI